jgi:DNA-binding XRE family transcriptional regulator
MTVVNSKRNTTYSLQSAEMIEKKKSSKKLPFDVAKSISELGKNLHLARKRRGLSARAVAERIGMDQRSVLDAEKGKSTTAVSTYLSLLWAYDLLGCMKDVADPMKDVEGIRLAAARENRPLKSDLDNDF